MFCCWRKQPARLWITNAELGTCISSILFSDTVACSWKPMTHNMYPLNAKDRDAISRSRDAVSKAMLLTDWSCPRSDQSASPVANTEFRVHESNKHILVCVVTLNDTDQITLAIFQASAIRGKWVAARNLHLISQTAALINHQACTAGTFLTVCDFLSKTIVRTTILQIW